MKKFTIKLFILSFLVLSPSKADAWVEPVAILGGVCALGAVVGAAVVGVVGGTVFLGCKAVKHLFSKEKISKEERAERKKRKREARAAKRKARSEKKARKRKMKMVTKAEEEVRLEAFANDCGGSEEISNTESVTV